MTDLTGQIKEQRGVFAKILSKIPGFKGYMEKETRRDADKIVRDVVAARYTDQLDQLYNFDYQLLSEADGLALAIDQCRVALGVMPAPPTAEGAAPAPTGPEALKAAMNTVKRVCTGLNDLYDKRQHLLVGSL